MNFLIIFFFLLAIYKSLVQQFEELVDNIIPYKVSVYLGNQLHDFASLNMMIFTKSLAFVRSLLLQVVNNSLNLIIPRLLKYSLIYFFKKGTYKVRLIHEGSRPTDTFIPHVGHIDCSF